MSDGAEFDSVYERVRDDAGLRAVLKAARTWGISPRRFLGWEPIVTHGHVYDCGRLVRTVVTTEVEWDEENRNLAMALAMYEADLCPGCSQPMSETTKRENEGLYVAERAIRCHWCTASHMASEMYAESPQPRALFVPVTLRSAENADAGEHCGTGAQGAGEADPQA